MLSKSSPISAFAVYKKQDGKKKNTLHTKKIGTDQNEKMKKPNLKRKYLDLKEGPNKKIPSSTLINGVKTKDVSTNKKKKIVEQNNDLFLNGANKEKKEKLKVKESISTSTPLIKIKKKSKNKMHDQLKNTDNGFHVSEDEDEQIPTLIPIEVPLENLDLRLVDGISELNKTDPTPEGLKLFKWLISPLKPSVFFEKHWEKEVLFIERNSSSYYSDILTTERLDNIFREFPLYYTRNVDVVSYENGVKEVHNEEGRVVASALYDYYSNGCSIRVLNPQTYDQKVHLLIATLQEYFGSMVGANVYLTPPGSQGFAPHYDDIEAFIIQLEGRKHWKLYKPQGSDILARDSSPNLKHEEIGEPFMEVTLNAGDLLYFPRGTIHEGRTDPDLHSFHITVSVYQHNSYADLLEQAIPEAIKTAALNNLEFRKGLPLNYLKHTGCVNKRIRSKKRKQLIENVNNLIDSLKEYINVDLAADKLGRRFMYDSMPPVLSKQEVRFTSKYDGDFMKDGKILNRIEIGMDTEVRLLRYYCLRLVLENEAPKIYYNTENAKYYHGEEEQFLSIDKSLMPCIEKLQRSYPDFIQVEDLPINDNIAKAQLVSDLWERGLIVTNGPLPPVSDDEYSDYEDNESSTYEEVTI